MAHISRKQRDFAAELGIDLPDWATKADARKLLEAEVRERKDDWRDHRVRGVGQLVRTLKLRFSRGQVVREEKYDSHELHVVDGVLPGKLRLRRLRDRHFSILWVAFWRGTAFQPKFHVLCTPPQDFDHEIFIGDPALLEQIRNHTETHERFRTKYGEFFAVAAIKRVHVAWQAEKAGHAPRVRPEQQAATPASGPREKFCVQCGARYTDKSAHHHEYRCPTCKAAGHTLSKERFCLACGEKFTAPTSTSRYCKSHRPSAR